MGTTHRIYTLTRKNHSLSHLIELMKKLNNSLCIGPNKKFYYDYKLKEVSRITEIISKYQINISDVLLDFKLNDSNQLNDILLNPKLYERVYFFNHQNTNPEKVYTSYWIDINSIAKSFFLTIGLPYTSGIEKSKEELAKVLKYLVIDKELIFIVHTEIDDLAQTIIDLNSSKFNGGWSYKDFFKISAWGNFIPRGSDQKRPADVTLSFEKKHFDRYKGSEKMGVAFHKALNEYFSSSNYYVEGSFISKFESGILNAIKDIDFLDLSIPIRIDINSNPEFSIQDLELSHNEESNLTMEDFDWLDSNPNHGDNYLNLWMINENEYEFEINISKQIDEDYYTIIEGVIGEGLEYRGME